MITHFKESEDQKMVSWQYNGQKIRIPFQYKVFANHIEYLDEVLIQSDVFESGRRNLTIYNADGSIKAQPEMPERKSEVAGVYSVWFGQGDRQVTVVLISDEFNPYQTACTFDLETYQFSNFHPTK